MAYTAPRTWTTGEVVTAAMMNTDIRDNMLETAVAKSTASGDLTYATGVNALARLGIGSSRQLLAVNAGVTAPVWFTPPSCRVFHDTTQSAGSTNAFFALSFNSERWDTDTMHSTVTNSSRVTFATPGIYHVFGNVRVTQNSTVDFIFVAIYRNDSTQIAQIAQQRVTSGDTILHIGTLYQASSADQVTLRLAAPNTLIEVLAGNSTSQTTPEFGAVWVAP